MKVDAPKKLRPETCSQCWKSEALCVCADVTPLSPKFGVVILQHPQEVRNVWGTARLLSLSLQPCGHRIGLSWRSLSAAVGEPVDPRKWAVLYTGSKKEQSERKMSGPFEFISKTKEPSSLQELEGIVVLDGNWKQAKTLWWRNPWLLRMNRVVLHPNFKSQYGAFRRQARKNYLCTLESVAFSLEALGEEAEVVTGLQNRLDLFLSRMTLFSKHTSRLPQNESHSFL